MDLGKLYFRFCGYFSEALDFTDDLGKRVLMARYDYLGGNRLIPLTAEEFLNLPDPGTICRVAGLVKVDSKSLRASLDVLDATDARSPKFQQPSDTELLAGAEFFGIVGVSGKQSGVYRDTVYRNVTIAFFGNSYKFSLSNDESLFNAFPDSGLCNISGAVETTINSIQRDSRTVRFCENSLLLKSVSKYSPSAPETSKRERPAA